MLKLNLYRLLSFAALDTIYKMEDSQSVMVSKISKIRLSDNINKDNDL